VNTQTVFVSLGLNGKEAFAVLLRFLESLSRRRAFLIGDFHQFLVRTRGTESQASDEMDVLLRRIALDQSDPEISRRLPELPWIDAYHLPQDDNRPPGTDRAGLAQKCWDEWVGHTVHDQSVPWFREINDAIESLRKSATRLAIGPTELVDVYVVANLTDPVESALAYALGRYLRTWHTADLQPVLIGVLAPREDVPQLAESARGCGVASLADLCRDWEQLGYRKLAVLDGRLSQTGNAIIRLTDHEIGTVLGQVLYAAGSSEHARRALFGDRFRRRPDDDRDSPLMTVIAAGYAFEANRFAEYAALRLIVEASDSENGTDMELGERVHDLSWPLDVENDVKKQPEHPVAKCQELSLNLEDVVTKDVAAIVARLNQLVKRAGYQELLEQEFFEDRPIVEWPDIVRDLVGIAQGGMLEPIENDLQNAVRERVDLLACGIQQTLKSFFQRHDVESRLIGGSVTLGSLRLLDTRLAGLLNKSTDKLESAREEESEGKKDHDREIARLFEMLRNEARMPPHWSALAVRAVLFAVFVTSWVLLQGKGFATALLPHPVEAGMWAVLGGGVLWGVSYAWFVLMRRWSCRRIVQGLLRNISLRYRVILNRMRLSALREYRHEIRELLRQAVLPQESSRRGEAGSTKSSRETTRSEAASDLARLPETLVQYAKAWRQEFGRLRESIGLIERDYQDSSYLIRLPRIPKEIEEVARQEFDEELRRVVGNLLQLDANKTDISPADRLDAVAACLAEEDRGIWQELMPAVLAAIPQEIPEYFELMVRRVQSTLYANCYEPMSVNNLLADMSCHQVRRRAAAKSKDVQAKLDALQEKTREEAKRGVLVRELFQKAVAPLPVSGIQIQGYFWLSPAGSEEDDYLLQEPGLRGQTKDHRDFTEDQATAILLAYAHGVKPSDVLEASGSIYKRLLERNLHGRKNQPEFVPIPESLTKDETHER